MSHLGEKDFTNRLDYIKAQSDLIQKGLYGGLPCEDLIMKGGSGSGKHKSLDSAISHAKELSKKTQKQHHVIVDTRSGGLVVSDKTHGANIHGVATNGEYKEHNHSDSVKKEIADQISSGKITKAEDLDIIKGGEGSKGGKVIGHTKSGKPIYESATHASHRNFTSGEHKEAIDLHESKIKTDKGNETTHYNQIDSHHNQLKAKKSKESENDSAETKAFKHNHAAATKEQREHVAESYFGDKKKDLTSVGKHHHEQLSDSLYEKMEADKKAKVKKAEGDVNDGTFDKAMTAEAGEGVTQKESVEHNPKDMQNPKSSDLKKAYEILGLGDLIEKAEGARGGKVIGHTKTGKPIYEELHPSHRSFTADEHKEAADLHLEAHGKIYNNQRNRHVGGFYSGSHNTPEEQDKMKNHRESMEWHESMARHVVASDKKKQAMKEELKKKLKN